MTAIRGHANRVGVLDRFLTYAKTKPGVWFARKDEIARWALGHRSFTPVCERGAPTITGLLGSVA
jgi:hypothetical protein